MTGLAHLWRPPPVQSQSGPRSDRLGGGSVARAGGARLQQGRQDGVPAGAEPVGPRRVRCDVLRRRLPSEADFCCRRRCSRSTPSPSTHPAPSRSFAERRLPPLLYALGLLGGDVRGARPRAGAGQRLRQGALQRWNRSQRLSAGHRGGDRARRHRARVRPRRRRRQRRDRWFRRGPRCGSTSSSWRRTAVRSAALLAPDRRRGSSSRSAPCRYEWVSPAAGAALSIGSPLDPTFAETFATYDPTQVTGSSREADLFSAHRPRAGQATAIDPRGGRRRQRAGLHGAPRHRQDRDPRRLPGPERRARLERAGGSTTSFTAVTEGTCQLSVGVAGGSGYPATVAVPFYFVNASGQGARLDVGSYCTTVGFQTCEVTRDAILVCTSAHRVGPRLELQRRALRLHGAGRQLHRRARLRRLPLSGCPGGRSGRVDCRAMPSVVRRRISVAASRAVIIVASGAFALTSSASPARAAGGGTIEGTVRLAHPGPPLARRAGGQGRRGLRARRQERSGRRRQGGRASKRRRVRERRALRRAARADRRRQPRPEAVPLRPPRSGAHGRHAAFAHEQRRHPAQHPRQRVRG